MFENLKRFFRINKKIDAGKQNSKNKAKERLHLVLMQDRANVSADFLDLMRKEIIEVIKKYIDIDEKSMDVRLTTETNEDGTQGAPALYANIPIISIKDETRKKSKVNQENKIIEAHKNSKEIKEDNGELSNETKEKELEKENNVKEENKINNQENITEKIQLEDNKVKTISNEKEDLQNKKRQKEVESENDLAKAENEDNQLNNISNKKKK